MDYEVGARSKGKRGGIQGPMFIRVLAAIIELVLEALAFRDRVSETEGPRVKGTGPQAQRSRGPKQKGARPTFGR